MIATNYEIVQKRSRSQLGLADITDFELKDVGQIGSEVILENPYISLYSLDFKQNRAVFVETPSEIDLSQAPFYYLAQYENAVRVLTLSFESMIHLAKSITIDDRRLVFIYSVGRAGSTLASQIFAHIDGVINISEPDALTLLVAARYYQFENNTNFLDLLRATVNLLCKTPAETAWVIKTRSFVVELGNFLHQIYPGTKNIFLYRNAETWLGSALGAYSSGVEKSENELYLWENKLRQSIAPLTPLIARFDTLKHLSSVSLLTLMWLSVMERYIQLHESGVEMLAIRYLSWHSAPKKTVIKMLDYCGIVPTDMALIQQVLEKDSQTGTFLSKENINKKGKQIQSSDLEELNQLLQNHAFISTADFKVPNAIDFSQ
jgi:hypothetical protein